VQTIKHNEIRPRSKTVNKCVHDHPLHLEWPDVLSTVGETSYGIRVGFIESDKVFTSFLFIYLFVSEVQSLLLSS